MKHLTLLLTATVLGCLLPGVHAAIKKASSKQADVEQPAGMNLIPWPKSISMAMDARNLSLTKSCGIVAMTDELKPLTTVLSDEILPASGFRVPAGSGKGAKGDIVLQINKNLQADANVLTVKDCKVVKTRDYAYTLTVGDRALVEGFDYRAVAEGTATLLQALRAVPGLSLALPMWEMSAEALINTYRLGISKRQERTWGPDNTFTAGEFEKRAAATEALVKKLLFPPQPK